MLSARIRTINLRAGLILTLLGVCALLAACGGRAYVYEPIASTDVQARAESQSEASVRVSAAVPGREETAAIFGLPLYDQGIQPIWLEIENNGSDQVRYAPVGTDSNYFAPLEVAYTNRSGFSDTARSEMERRFYELAMPRYIDPGETRSGFVFTHAAFGAKGFNVDLFSSNDAFQFTFLLRVPGFVPDYANVDFKSIYAPDQLTVFEEQHLYDAIKNLPCCSTSASDDEGEGAVNVFLVGAGPELLRSLLRSNWIETGAAAAADTEPDFLFGRQQDAIFRRESRVDDSYYELRLWLAPVMSGENRVWAGQVRHFFGLGKSTSRTDPDVDHARNYAMQSFLYGQSLEKFGWVAGEEVVPVQSFWENLIRPAYFTGGHRVVLWLSGEPLSLADVESLDWDKPPASNE